MRIKANVLGVIVLLVIFGGVATSSLFNIWSTTSTKEPARYQTGNFKGQYNPSDIRGSYTFKDVNNAFNISVSVLGEAFGVQDYEELNHFQLKNLETIYGDLKSRGKEIGTDSVRVFVALYLGLPIQLSEDNYLLKPAVDILIDRGIVTEEQSSFIKAHAIDLDNMTIEADLSSGEDKESEHIEDIAIKGKTTFAEAIEWGIEKDILEEIVGGKLPTQGMTIRDYCNQNGIGFSDIKEKLNQILEDK